MLLVDQVQVLRENLPRLEDFETCLPLMGGVTSVRRAYDFIHLIHPARDIITCITRADPSGNRLHQPAGVRVGRNDQDVGTRVPAIAFEGAVMVELAMDALGLCLHAEEARCFTRSGRAYLPAEDRLATSVGNGRLIRGWSVHVPGLALRPGELAKWMQEQRGFIDAAGRILDIYLEHRQKAEAPLLVERWVNGLHWFGEARREVADSMAVVKYGCALDGVTGAEGNVDRMAAFVKAVLKPDEDEERKDSALSINDAVDMVCGRDGRSGVAHGGMPGLLEDFRKPRRVGDGLLARLFFPLTLALAELIEEGSEALTLSRKHAFRALEARASKML